MDQDANQQQLLSDSPIHMIDTTMDEEIPVIDKPPDKTKVPIEWNTSKLCEVCREGDLEGTLDFIEYSQQNLNCRKNAAEIADRLEIDTGLSPLHHAARYQQLDVCLVLLSRIEFKLGVNIKDEQDRTPIFSAFRSSSSLNTNNSQSKKQINLETDLGNQFYENSIWQDEYQNKIFQSDHPLIYLFAKANGDINARDKYLFTPLHYAVARNNLAGVKQLITLNADIESRDRQGIRPLHIACKEGYLPIAEYLIEHGAKLDAIDADEWTVLHHACAKGHRNIIRLLKSKEEIDFQELIRMKTNIDASCLHLAVQHGNILSVKFILTELHGDALKASVNEQVEPFGTPLHIAAKFCDPSMVYLLCQYKADPLILNSHHQSPLHIACAFNRFPIVKELFSLTHSSLLEIKDDRGQTALSVTTNSDIVSELIAAGADISSLDNNRMNVLMIAVTKGHLSIVELLLFAINDNLAEIFNQVTKRDNRSIFLIAVEKGSIDMCSLLLTHPNVRWDTTDKQRMNAFHIAAQNNHHELIELLCKHIRKSDKLVSMKSRSYSVATPDLEIYPSSPTLHSYIDAQTEDGKTPLHLAAEHGHTLCVKILLKYGADVFRPDYIKQLAFHVAIQNGYSQCVDLLTQASIRNMTDFEFVLSSRHSPLITACQNGFVDIVRLLLSQGIGIDYDDQEENPLEVAIKYEQIETIYVLLEHPYAEHWLMSIRKTKKSIHQTPLRDMIEQIPECAKHVFDKFITKTNETGLNGNAVERITYNYKFIDDYFTDNGKLYTTSRRHLYRNHPFIIALDSEHDFLLKHPLAGQLMARKWKLYRPLFYLSLILTILLLLILTSYVLTVPAPNNKSSPTSSMIPFIKDFILPMQWMIVTLAGMNLFKLILEIILYHGLRVPFAQLFSLISFVTSLIAFIPYEKNEEMIYWQWQLAALSTLFQWFNIAFILRSVPSIGYFIVMFQSILLNSITLLFVILPLLIAFTIATQMIFYNHSAFFLMTMSMHKLSAMVIGEFNFETLFYAKPTFLAAAFIFIPFIAMMTIVFMNLLLGVAVGDIHICLTNAQAKANAYRIRELIYIEATLPSLAWLKSNIKKDEVVDDDPKDSILKKNNEQNEKEDDDEDYNEPLSNRLRVSELGKLLDILNMLCTQAKQSLGKEIHLEAILKQLLAVRKTSISMESTSDG